jgi:phosphoribosylaminoimidazole-succinocarboxamide synthase
MAKRPARTTLESAVSDSGMREPTVPKRFSTKNLTVVEEPTRGRAGIGIFEFTDDYSVFHFGKMPDQIPGKGEAICRMAVHNFRMLREAGVPTHFRRFLPPNLIEFTLLAVHNPEHEPIPLHQRAYLVPLQVIFRNTLPPNNSLERRLAAGVVGLADIGLTELPADGRLTEPLVEYTTKLEEIDRFVSTEEAQRLAALDDAQFAELRRTALRVDELITAHARQVGMAHADGKVEFGVAEDGGIVLVDNAGTPDENRLTYQGHQVGKQLMRDYYLAQDLEREVQVLAAEGVPRHRWPRPKPLPMGFVPAISDMYRSLCELWTGERIWYAPPLAEVIETTRLLNTEAAAW